MVGLFDQLRSERRGGRREAEESVVVGGRSCHCGGEVKF